MKENAISVDFSEDLSELILSGARTFTADFGLNTLLLDERRSVIRGNLTDKLRSPSGGAALGFLVTAVDIVTSDPALVAGGGDWTATQDLSLHAVATPKDGPIFIDANLVRVGKKTVVVSADVYDGHGREDLADFAKEIDSGAAGTPGGPTLVARGLVTFARLPRHAAPHADLYTPEQWVGKVRGHPERDIDGDVYERLDLRVVDAEAGVLELDRTLFVINQIGTIQGGAQALLAEAAAHTMRPGLVATDMLVRYLSQVRSGPARSYGTVVRDAPDHSVIDIRLVDAGDDDRVLALVTVTLQRP